MTQIPLDYSGKKRAPFAKGSPTSAQAAADIVPFLPRLEAHVYRHIHARGELGLTDDEVECLTGLRHQTASARRRGLVLRNLVVDSGRTRPTRSGRNAVVWIAVGGNPE